MRLRACAKRSCNVFNSEVAHTKAVAANSRGFHVASGRPDRPAKTDGASNQSRTCFSV